MSFSVGLLKEVLKDPAATWAAGGVKPGSQKRVVLSGTSTEAGPVPAQGSPAALRSGWRAARQPSASVDCFVVLVAFLNMICLLHE